MKLTPLAVAGAYVIAGEPREDARGFFARMFCAEELAAHGLEGRIAQCNLSWNHARGTLRGMHYQTEPFSEVKIVRCTRGSVYDVVFDVRPDSPTYGKHAAVTLTAENRLMCYVPRGCAHGYQTLEADCEVFYTVSAPYAPSHERGIRWDDPAINIAWPVADPILSPRDQGHPHLVTA